MERCHAGKQNCYNGKSRLTRTMPQTWHIFEDGPLFETVGPGGDYDDAHHLAHMVALLGPPPKEFLERSYSNRVWQFFEKDGELLLPRSHVRW